MDAQEAWSTAMAWLGKARERSAAGEPGRVEDALAQALPLLARVGEELTEGNTWLWLGRIRLERGNPVGALEAFAEAWRCFEAGGHRAARARTSLAMGEALLWRGAIEPAVERLEEAASGLSHSHAGVGEVLAWCLLGEARTTLGQIEAAGEAFDRARRLARELNAPAMEARAVAGLSRAALSRGALHEAMRHVEEAVDASASIEDQSGVGWGLLLQAEVVMASGRPGTAWKTTRRAMRLFRLSGCAEGMGAAGSWVARWPWWRVVWAELMTRLSGRPRQLPPPGARAP